jgi:hypothetical protein
MSDIVTVFDGWLGHLRSEGRMTLQVPELALPRPFTTPLMARGNPQTVDVPEGWVWRLKVDRKGERIAVGRELGFLGISPAGYASNRDEIVAAWQAGCARIDRGFDAKPETFDRFAERHFAAVKATSLWVAGRKSCPTYRADALRSAVSRLRRAGGE